MKKAARGMDGALGREHGREGGRGRSGSKALETGGIINAFGLVVLL